MISLKKTNIYNHRKYFLWKFIKDEKTFLDIGNIGFLEGKVHKNSFFRETFKRFKKTEFYGIDIELPTDNSPEYLNQIQHDVNTGIPFDNNSFDYIYLGQILEHLENPNFVISEIYRVLVNAGKLIIDVPNPYSIDRILKYLLFRTEHLGEPSHLIFYTPDSINRLLTKNNFIIQEIATDWEFQSKKYWLIPKFFRSGLGSHLLVCAIKK